MRFGAAGMAALALGGLPGLARAAEGAPTALTSAQETALPVESTTVPCTTAR